jgi:excisionase family DNA binding protein
MTEPWLSVLEIAQHLGVAKESIYRWLKNKGLPGHKIGSLWKFKASEVDRWALAGATQETPDKPEKEQD